MARASLSEFDRRQPLVVIAADAALHASAAQLAHTLGVPLCTSGPAGALVLTVTGARLELHDLASGARLWVEFTEAELRRYRPGAAGRDLLRRALGPSGTLVFDATAGLGRDAVHMTCLGYRVIATERNPVVAALTRDGVARARAAQLIGADNPQCRLGDARAVLPTLDPAPDVIYLDPMFPDKRKKSAAVRKEMRLLRALVAHDSDAAELFALACRYARERVVVKRADDAPPLAPNAHAVYTGKLVRYDVYKLDRHG